MTTTLTGGSSTLPHPPGQPPEVVQPAAGLHLFAVSVALTVLCFVQAPGRIAPDTKADLSIDPVGFLLRAGNLWEPLGDSGQLQNQAYGYFLPMGPFYALGHLLGFPAWVVQRAWWAVVLLVAFHGVYRLCRALDIGTHAIRIVAALTFALSPRMITEIGPVSIEAWPMAMAPWVLLPLVKVRPGGEIVAAARSGLAIALCGGVNAIAVGAVLPLPVWWLLTREKGPVRRALVRWWSLAAVLATLWWVAPLLLLGRFSPPFLDWVESAAVSTSKATLPGAFRGTTQWVAWFALPQPIWLAGWSVLSSPGGILLGWVLITIAVLGMLRRDMPHRRFVIGAALGGIVLLTTGHVGPLTAPWAPAVQDFLDGAGAPLRNTHKFDVVLRLPMALALAHALTSVTIPRITLPGLPSFPRGPRLAQFVAICALIGSAAPALVGQLPARGSFTEVPDHWRQAAAWLAANDDGARTLILPGSTFATSIWGDPHDEPFQALARTKWATRSGVPLSSAGNIRLLNAIEQQVESGRGSPGLAEFLARAGISRVLLRSDLVRSFQAGSPPLPVMVRSALQASAGLRPVARFGEQVSGRRTVFEVADDGLDVPQAAIEIWEVEGQPRIADLVPAAGAYKVTGGPEALLGLAEANQLGNRPVVLAGDPLAAALQDVPTVLSDSLQRREANFAQVRDNYSLVMTADEPYQRPRRVHDWVPFEAPRTIARYEGISGVATSSSAATSTGGWLALDGDPSTSWTSQIYSVGQWLEVTFPQPTTLTGQVTLTVGGAARVVQAEVVTDRGAERTTLSGEGVGRPQPIVVPAGSTSRLRVSVTRVAEVVDQLRPVSISELSLPGVEVARPLVVPPPPEAPTAPSLISLRSARDGVDGCVFSDERAICSPRLRRQSQDRDLDRELVLPRETPYRAVATARFAAGAAADLLLAPDPGAMRVTASSRRTDEPAERPQAAADRSPGTGWVAGYTDQAPTLEVSWPQARPVNRVRWQVDPGLAASRPAALEVVINGDSALLTPDEAGWVRFPGVRTDRIRLIVRGVRGLQSLDRASRLPSFLPVGASEIVVPGPADETRQAWPRYRSVRLACGSGPPLEINGTTVPTRVAGTTEQVLRRASMSVVPCGEVPALRGGTNRVTLRATESLEPESLSFLSLDPAARVEQAPAAVAPQFTEQSKEQRSVRVDAAAETRVLIVHENFNPGWRARVGSLVLEPVRMDGWQQGYLVPAGVGGTIELRFTPGPQYRIALGVGLLLVAMLAVLALPRRRAAVARAGSRRSRHAAVVALAEDETRRGYGVAGIGALVLIGGGWGLVVLGGLVVAMARRVQVRFVVLIAGAVAGMAAARTINADEAGALSVVSIVAALLLVACLTVRLDSAAENLLGRVIVLARRVRPSARRAPAPPAPVPAPEDPSGR